MFYSICISETTNIFRLRFSHISKFIILLFSVTILSEYFTLYSSLELVSLL